MIIDIFYYLCIIMTLVIIVILLLGLLLIASAHLTHVNKAAIAVFMGTVCWVLYICYGADYVMNFHQLDYLGFLEGAKATSVAVKHYIAEKIFINYVGRAAEVVLFLLVTMTIVEILNNNGCFDFLIKFLKTRNSKTLLWSLSVVTFLLSANLDNLTTTVMMLTIMHQLLSSRRLRWLYGSAIFLSASCGGIFTVIGDPVGLVLWSGGLVSATSFSSLLILPCLVAWALPIFMIGRELPERLDLSFSMPYRGDDTNLNVWQRFAMLLLGIGGLWFIPTFHNITKLSPFLGALCVLSLLWIINEIFNRKLMNVDDMIQRRIPRVLQYGVIQMIFFVMGIILSFGVIQETGFFVLVRESFGSLFNDRMLLGVSATVMSLFLDNFATAMLHVSINPFRELNDSSWAVIAYGAQIGGNIFMVSSLSGIAFMKAEHISIGWYFKHVGCYALLGGILGLIILYLTLYL